MNDYKQLHAYLNDEQTKDLHDAIAKLKTSKQHSVFFEILVRKFFLKGREFSDALNSAKGVI